MAIFVILKYNSNLSILLNPYFLTFNRHLQDFFFRQTIHPPIIEYLFHQIRKFFPIYWAHTHHAIFEFLALLSSSSRYWPVSRATVQFLVLLCSFLTLLSSMLPLDNSARKLDSCLRNWIVARENWTVAQGTFYPHKTVGRGSF